VGTEKSLAIPVILSSKSLFTGKAAKKMHQRFPNFAPSLLAISYHLRMFTMHLAENLFQHPLGLFEGTTWV
jgi:hypothetical protein